MVIKDEVTISGAGMTATIIDGNATSRIFGVAKNLGAVTIQDLTIQNGNTGSGAGVSVGSGTPTLIQRVALKNNVASSSGGAVHMAGGGDLTVLDSVISGNSATAPGGSAFILFQGDHLTLRNSTLTNNGPSDQGVIIDWSNGSAPVTVDIENSTISGNQGTALFANSSNVMTVTNSTITNNSEGIRAGAGNGASTVTVTNSIIYGNGLNCAVSGGSIVSGGNNIDSLNSCGFAASGDQVNTDPRLGPLANNGGPTPTCGLLADSPALNAGDNTTCPGTDQRGVNRDDGSCDIGAFEGSVAFATCLPAAILVDSTLDAADAAIGDGFCNDGNGNCTLRAAIQETNACTGIDVIELPAGIYLLTLAGINENLGVKGDLDILDELTIKGASVADTVIDGSDAGFDDRLFQVHNGFATRFETLTLQGVNVNWDMHGGGIATNGNLSVFNVVFDNNTAGNGSGIYATGSGTSVAIDNASFTNNNGQGSGSGVFVGSNVTLNISASSFTGNSLPYEYGHNGAAVYGGTGATINIVKTLIDGSDAGYAQAVWGHSNSTINITDSTVSNSQSGTTGITGWSGSTVNIVRSTISGNLSGGIYTREVASVLNITDSSITNNEVHALGSFTADGGGASIGGAFTITGSTFSGNRIINDGFGGNGSGAGIYIAGSGTISNSTFSANSSNGSYSRGGAIGGPGTLTLINTTITGNYASYSGGGIGLQNGALTVVNSIVANNRSGVENQNYGNCDTTYMTVVSNGNNIESLATCGFTDTTDKANTDPLLDPLADNGGLTQTHALQVGSPAIDAGDDAVCAAAPVNGLDQRGIVRPQGNQCDIGAYESVVNSPG